MKNLTFTGDRHCSKSKGRGEINKNITSSIWDIWFCPNLHEDMPFIPKGP